jgi:hypothetical protein
MRVATVTATLKDGYGDLRPEAAMVKGALLYADGVRIVSGKFPMLLVQTGEQFRGLDRLKEELEGLGDDGGKALAALLEGLRSRNPAGAATFERLIGEGATPAAIVEVIRAVWREQIEPRVKEGSASDHEAFVWNLLPELVRVFAGRNDLQPEPLVAAADDLRLAARAGLAEFDLLEAQRTFKMGADELIPETMERLIEAVVAMAVDPGRLYPLFDDRAYRLARSLASDASTSPLKNVGIAQALVVSLESFPMASMDVVLDVRERLRPALGRFRAAVAEAARELDEFPADAGFAVAVEDLRVRKVGPALQNIKEELEDISARPTLLRGWPKVAVGTIGLTAAAAVKAPELAQVAPLLAGVSAAFTTELTERAKLKRGRERNQFFFLHTAEAYLSEGIDDGKRRR